MFEWGESQAQDFPGGSMVKNPPPNPRDRGFSPGWVTKIPHAMGQLNLRATTREACVPQQRPSAPKHINK